MPLSQHFQFFIERAETLRNAIELKTGEPILDNCQFGAVEVIKLVKFAQAKGIEILFLFGWGSHGNLNKSHQVKITMGYILCLLLFINKHQKNNMILQRTSATFGPEF